MDEDEVEHRLTLQEVREDLIISKQEIEVYELGIKFNIGLARLSSSDQNTTALANFEAMNIQHRVNILEKHVNKIQPVVNFCDIIEMLLGHNSPYPNSTNYYNLLFDNKE